MLTDTEVAETTRRLLADELAGLRPPASLLADVRARHAKTLRARRAATGALATITAAALAAGVAAGTGSPARVTTGDTGAATAPSAAGHGGAGTQTIVLDGYTIRAAAPLRLTSGPHGHPIATLFGRRIMLTVVLQGGHVPEAAVRVTSWQRPAYLLRSGSRLSLYLPFPVAARGYHSLVLSGAGLTESELLRISAAITVGVQGHS